MFDSRSQKPRKGYFLCLKLMMNLRKNKERKLNKQQNCLFSIHLYYHPNNVFRMKAVEEEILSEHDSSDASFGSPPQSSEFLPPYPKPVLPLRNPEQVYSKIESAYQRLSKSPKALRWIRFEYFYSVGDEIYFRHNEFIHTIKMVCSGYNNEKEMPIKEWRKLRRQMGPPKRLSRAFLQNEREKLHIWRSNSLNVRLGVVRCCM